MEVEEGGVEEVSGGVVDSYCIFCGSVVVPKKEAFLDDPNFPSVWTHLCTQMEVPVATRDNLLKRLQRGEGTFCTKTCRPVLSTISKLLTQIDLLREQLEEKTTEIRNRVIAASALDQHAEGVDEESLVYSFRLVISRHFKVIERHTRKSGPCPRSKKSSSSVSKKKSEAPPPNGAPPPPPDAPGESPPKCGMTLRNKSLPAVEVKDKEECETDTDESDTETPSTTEDMDCSAPPAASPSAPTEATVPPPNDAEEEEESAPPPPKRRYKYQTPRETSGSLQCPKCPFTAAFSSSAEKITSRSAVRSHYHAEHFYKKLVSREDLQKTPSDEHFFACPSCPFRAVVKNGSKHLTQASREHKAITALRNQFLQSHEGESKISGKIQKLHGGFVGNSVLPEFNPDSAEENIDFFKCPFGGCEFISQVIDPHAKYPKGQEHRRSAILRVARHYLKFHEDLVSFEKTRRNPAVVRDPETQGEILKCTKCEYKLEYISHKKSSQHCMVNQLKFKKHYASHILPIYTSRPNLYQTERRDE